VFSLGGVVKAGSLIGLIAQNAHKQGFGFISCMCIC